MEVAESRQRGLAAGIVLLMLTAAVAVALSWHAAAILLVMPIAFLFRCLFSLRKELISQFRLNDWYERGLMRLEGKWSGQGSAGEEFTREAHLYERDLDILGPGSLFELLNSSRSGAGAERLAAYLLDPVDISIARARQAAVIELQAQPELRESLALVGRYGFQECNPRALRDWLKRPNSEVAKSIPAFLFISSANVLVFGSLTLIGFLAWQSAIPFLLPLLAVQAIAGLGFMRRVRPVLDGVAVLTGEFAILRDGLAIVRAHAFKSEKLRVLVESIGPDALSRLTTLQRLSSACEQRRKDVFYQFSLFLCFGTQLAFAIERWRRKYGPDLACWLETWAEFEALNAIACYAYEHPGYVYPEFSECADPLFHAENLGHPLLPTGACVTNNVYLDDKTAFHLVTGSNMSGKSTWLRTVGLAAVLAAAGAPIRATKARMSLFTVCASISVLDSLSTGKSKFLAEIEGLRSAIDAARYCPPVLFMIDEILSGTNSADRRRVAASVVDALTAAGAVGLLSTHDDALVPLAEDMRFRGQNFHMGGENPDDPLDFDYRVKPGPAQQTNALAIARMVGIMQITNSAI